MTVFKIETVQDLEKPFELPRNLWIYLTLLENGHRVNINWNRIVCMEETEPYGTHIFLDGLSESVLVKESLDEIDCKMSKRITEISQAVKHGAIAY